VISEADQARMSWYQREKWTRRDAELRAEGRIPTPHEPVTPLGVHRQEEVEADIRAVVHLLARAMGVAR
jgi:hypothetical protein